MAGTPLVISLQHPVCDDDISFFTNSLNQGLRERGDLLSTIREARLLLHRDWYSPTIYVRHWRADAVPEIPRRLFCKRYYLLQPIVQAAGGALFFAHDLVLNLKCQVLIFHRFSDGMVEQFRERIQKLISEPGRTELRLLDFFLVGERCFFVMDYEPDPQVVEKLYHLIMTQQSD
jgi:hypothetical protein